MASGQGLRFAIRAIASLFSHEKSNAKKQGRLPLMGLLVPFVLLVTIYVVITSPMGAWALLFEEDEEALPLSSNTSFGIYDLNVDGSRVSWYMEEAARLERWARDRWNTGRGDIYNTPDWRYLYAFDMALSENDYELVCNNQDYYQALHKNLVSATSVNHSVTVYVDASYPGATYDEEKDAYCYVEHYTTWTINTKDFNSFFKKRINTGDISEDFLYFVGFESGDWGAEGGWGDQGNALGGLQFDRRYGLDDFLAYAINKCPSEYSFLAPWAAQTVIEQADPELLEAWRCAYTQDPDKWIELQISFEYDAYYVPGEKALLTLGFDCSQRPDAIKGLVASLCNLNGIGGATRYFARANLTNEMNDEEVARALAYAFINNPPEPYPEAYANRYTEELSIVLDLLASSNTNTSSTPATHLGDNPDAEGKSLALDQKGEIAQNYQRSLYALTIYYDEYGLLTAEIDKDKFEQIVIEGQSIKGLDVATTEQGRSVVEACQLVESTGPGMCAAWITEVYRKAGLGSPAGHANEMWRDYCTSTDVDELVPGMIIAVQHSAPTGDGYTYGHVGIYVGEVEGVASVMDNIGYIRTISLDAWIAENNYSGDVAWGWAL